MDKYFRRLERLFGKTEEKEIVTARFEENYFNGIKGWQFEEKTINEYNSKGKLLTMDLDLPSPCKLDCVYCFAKEDAYYRPQASDKPLKIEEIKEYLLDAKKLGLQSTKIIGFGEPFESPAIFDFIEFASKNNIQLVIFTAAYTIGEKHFGGATEDVIEFLHKNKVSLMLKLHTISSATDDKIVGVKGYSKARNRYLKMLIDYGKFNDQNPTRLGVENVIASQNIQELVSIYKYFKIYKNLFVDLDPPIPVGRTNSLEKCERIGMKQKDTELLCDKIYSLNRKYKIPFRGFSSFFGGPPCSQLSNGLYLTLSGKIMTCCGGNEQIGDIRKHSLKEAFERDPYRKNPKTYHICPYRKIAGTINEKFVSETNRKFFEQYSLTDYVIT